MFVIRHRDGVVLFDTGQDRRSVEDPAGYYPSGPTGILLRRVADLDVPPDAALPALLAHEGVDPRAITHVVLSHFHVDHVGGLRYLGEAAPQAHVLAADTELATLGDRRPELRGVLPRHIDRPGLTWVPVPAAGRGVHDAGHDVLGDGSLTVLATPGHTPGSQTLLVRGATARPLLLVGDATFSEELLRRHRIPGVGDRRVLRITSRELLETADRHDAVILPAHDPGTGARLARASV